MRWSIIQEADRSSSTNEERYHEVIEEVALADRLGFHAYGTSEQHFFPPKFTVSSPEVLYAAIAMRTERIKLRPMIVVPMTWHHPILIAERLGALDILSRGRVELATGRGNNLNTLKVFGVDPSDTREIYAEAMDAVEAILDSPDEVEHHGKYWDFQKTTVVPQMVNARYPDLSMAAASVESHAVAADRGYGVISFENYFGFEFLQECIDTYRKKIAQTPVEPHKVNDYVGLCVGTAFCGSTTEQARERSGAEALNYLKTTLEVYKPMANQPGYTYMDRINTLIDKQDDMDWLCEETSVVMVGTPDDFIRRGKKLEAMGVDEIILRIDGLPHEHIMESIELMGREVLPAFSND